MDDQVNLVLDPEIRNWVLIPLCVIIFLVQALRTYLLEFVKPKHAADIDELRQKCVLRVKSHKQSSGIPQNLQGTCCKVTAFQNVRWTTVPRLIRQPQGTIFQERSAM